MHTVYNQQRTETDRLQAVISEQVDMITHQSESILQYETKFDLIAENEAKRMIEFGEAVKGKCKILNWASPEIFESIDIESIYTNFKKG